MQTTADYLRGVAHFVPGELVVFGKALDAAGFLSDGWPYFLEKPWKWASEYDAWTLLDKPQADDQRWDAWLEKLDAIEAGHAV